MSVTVLKLHGLKCPLPVLKTRKALSQLTAGDFIQVECTDALSAIDIPAFVQQSGHTLNGVERRPEGVLVFRIQKGSTT